MTQTQAGPVRGRETRLRGLGVSEGLTIARICLFHEERHNHLPACRVRRDDADSEWSRVRDALRVAVERLAVLQNRVRERLGAAEAEIFVAQGMILQDESLIERIRQAVRDDVLTAESAVAQAFDADEARLREVESDYLRERATDIGEAKRRVLDVLADLNPSLECNEAHCRRGRNRVVVATELTPSLTVEMDSDHLMGFVTEHGGRNSHAAILARALGVPAVSAVKGIRRLARCGDEILVNGATGEVVLHPSEETINAARASSPLERRPQPVAPVSGLSVLANISGPHELPEAVEMRAEGIGLYRTEFDLILAGRMLSVDELSERYAQTLDAMGDRPVVFRLFDAGSDKPLPFLDPLRENNPALGLRGVRLLLDQPDLLRCQARALAQASRGRPLRLLYPMIADLAQFQRARDVVRAALADPVCGPVAHGVMLEVPAACLDVESLLADADFASVGTNDLVQYLFAVDRDNDRVSADFCYDHPVLWNLLERMAQIARRLGKPLCVCGELGGDPACVRRLMALGIAAVSTTPRRISSLRLAVGAT